MDAKYQQMTVGEALASLHGKVQGISQAEAFRRLREHGKNKIAPVSKKPPMWMFLQI